MLRAAGAKAGIYGNDAVEATYPMTKTLADGQPLDGSKANYTLTYADLEGGSVLFAHIHFGARGVNGGVIAFLCGGGGKPACPAAPATVTGTITAADIVGPAGQGIEAGSFDEAVRAIRAGAVYANVHTTRWGGGEIRGQVNDSNQRADPQ